MGSVRRVLYPLRVALALTIVSVVLYLFFNIWPIAYSLYIAFTDANANNIVPSPKLLELLSLRANVTRDLETRRGEISSYLARIDSSISRVISTIESFENYINQNASKISIAELNSYIGNMSSEMLEVNSLVTAEGYYLNYYPELRGNISKANEILGSFRTEISSVLFFKISISEEDLNRIRNISYKYLPQVVDYLNSGLMTLRTIESDYDLFVERVVGDIDRQIDALTLHFVGLENFRRLFTEASYPYAVYKTLLFVATSVPLKVIVGVGIAFLFSSPLIAGRRIMRALLVLPWALPPLLTITTWRMLFLPGVGPFAQFFSAFLGRSFNIYNLEWDAFTVYNIVETWLAYPFIMTVAMGAIAGVPREIIEATYIDGASILYRFRRVTLPLTLRPIAFAAIMTTGASLQAFLVPLLINGGGPATMISFPGTSPQLGYSNDFIILYGYRQAYFYRDYGLSAASYLFAVLILLVYALLWYYFLYRKR
ncbi:MAG: sugar ABC transporter permease [Sulfolobales archaeon]